MGHILFSDKYNVEFDDNNIKINDVVIADDEKKELSNEDFAKQKMREFYSNFLSKQFDNIVILSGAGTSVGIGTDEEHKGKTMRELWQVVVDRIGINKLRKFAKNIKIDENRINEEYVDLEWLISKANMCEKVEHNEEVEKQLIVIEKLIKENCRLTLPPDAPHIAFLRKITARKLKYSRVKIFTLNYDLLFEQAASEGAYVVIDGFSFSNPRIFKGTNYDYDIIIRNANSAKTEENYAPKVFHLYKPHGSLDWDSEIISEDEKRFIKKDNPQNPVMIYPSSSKFEYSYEQPYFEMMSRLQQELRSRNTLLIAIGFSFYDKHIKAMVMEALDVNMSITLIIVSPSVECKDSFTDFKKKINSNGNIVLIAEKFSDFVVHYPYSEIYDYTNLGVQNVE